MKVCPISVSTVRNHKNCSVKKCHQNPNFTGKGGALGALAGAVVGGVLIAATGGAAAAFLGAVALTGGGGVLGECCTKSNDNYSTDPKYPNHRDY